MTALNYTAGTVSLTNGSAVVTGVGTAWQIALIVGGTIYVEAAGNPLPIDSVDSDTQITAAIAWAGATGAYNYVLRRSTTYDEQVAKNAEIFARLVAELEAGTIWKYDASGDTAGRASYDTRPKGFSYLDTSGAQPVLWVKASNDEADWAGPFSYGVGPVGPAPTLGIGTVTTRPAGQPATATISGSGGSYSLSLGLPAGELTPEDEAQLNAAVDAASVSAAEAAFYAEIVGAAAYDFNFDTDPSPTDDWNN